MKGAFPIRQGRISPLFDRCGRLLVVEDREGAERVREEISLAGLSRFERAPKLKELGVDVLVCGGISPWVAAQVEGLGIGLLPWTAGPVDQVVEAFFQGRLPHPAFTLPGRGRRRRGRWGGRGPRGPAGPAGGPW